MNNERNIEFTLSIKNNTGLELQESVPNHLGHELQELLTKNYARLYKAKDILETEGIPFIVSVTII